MHKEQESIINNLIFTNKLSFSKLNTNKTSTDRFNFHLKQLIKKGYVEKNESMCYLLTEKGKEYALRVGPKSNKVSKQGVLGVVVLPIIQGGGKRLYLIQKRMK